MATARETMRVANLGLSKTAAGSLVTVGVPKDLRFEELATLNKSLVEKVIKDLTGCACLSGTIDVLYQSHFERAMQVDLGSGTVTQVHG